MATTNYSIFAIPLYLILTMVPHIWSAVLLYSHSAQKSWDGTNPRSTTNTTRLQKTLPKAALAQHERLRAAHANMFDNMAFVIGGILAGNMAGLDAGWLNSLCVWYLGTRLAWLLSYAWTEKIRYAWVRAVWYTVGSVIIAWLYWDAGWVVARQSELEGGRISVGKVRAG